MAESLAMSTSKKHLKDELVTEHIVDFTVNCLSNPKNINPTTIQGYFIPILLSFSEKFDGGRIFDISVFKERLSNEQKEFCTNVFSQAKIIKMNSNLIMENDLFFFLKQFEKATHLEIILNDDDAFIFPLEKFKFETVIIKCFERTLWADPVNAILDRNLAILKTFSLENGYINDKTILNLAANELNTLELKNVIINTDHDRDRLIKYILRLEKLQSLKAIFTKPLIRVNSFNKFFEYLQQAGAIDIKF